MIATETQRWEAQMRPWVNEFIVVGCVYVCDCIVFSFFFFFFTRMTQRLLISNSIQLISLSPHVSHQADPVVALLMTQCLCLGH